MSTKHRRKPYMPDSDRGKADWMERFISILEKDPEKYGFYDPRYFEYVQRTIRTFIDATKLTLNKARRSTSTVQAKNDARAAAVDMCRGIAMRLKFDPTLTDEDVCSLGIRTHHAAPEAAKLPTGVLTGTAGYPELVVLNSPNGGHLIRYRDVLSPAKSKPKGVSHLLLFGAIGEKPHMRPTHARLLGAYTKRPFEIMYPMECGIEGLHVTYYGRWLTTRGEMSPWSPGVSRIIGGTQVLLRESSFGHIFGEQGFIDALPQGMTQQPMLESGADRETDGVVSVLEPRALPWRAFALLESEMSCAVRREESGPCTQSRSSTALSTES